LGSLILFLSFVFAPSLFLAVLTWFILKSKRNSEVQVEGEK
jgi:hypothetical protein